MSQNEELLARVARLEAELDELRESQARPTANEPFSRRHLLKLAGAAVTGAGVAAVAGAEPAAAASGDNLRLGLSFGGNSASSGTEITYTHDPERLPTVDYGFRVLVDAGTAGAAVYGFTQGTGNAVRGDISNASTQSAAVQGNTNGLAAGVFGDTTGPGAGVRGNTNSSGPAVFGTTTGTGAAVQGDVSNAGTNSSAVLGQTNGAGAAVKGITTGSGGGVQGDISNAATLAAAVQGNTNGAGAAVLGDTTGAGPALQGRSSGPYPTVVAENTGTGSQLYVVPKGSVGPPAPGSKGQIHLDANGDVFQCKSSSGTQAVWTRVGFNPLDPLRICDTRPGAVPQNGVKGKRTHATNTRFVIPGVAGVPTAGATAVMMNITAVNAEVPGYFSVYPGPVEQSDPQFSNVNFYPRADGVGIPNLVVSKLGSDGSILVFCGFGPVDLIVDVLGFFA